MNVSSIAASTDYLAQTATHLKRADVQQAVQVSVMKKVMDQQAQAGEVLIKMIENTPGAVGSRLDVRA